MERSEHRERLRAFLETIRHADRPVGDLADDDPLVASGLIDSLAVVELIIYLESEVGLDFSQTGVQPDSLRSVTAILDLIARNGK
jgi:acyl carrier protein